MPALCHSLLIIILIPTKSQEQSLSMYEVIQCTVLDVRCTMFSDPYTSCLIPDAAPRSQLKANS